jgi:DNA-binding transcriptional regulator YdaS (Cro superfamily)
MKLLEFMHLRELGDAQMAALIGCSRSAVVRWRIATRIPRPEMMRRIAAVTEGKVTANDFFSGPPVPPVEAA